MRGPKKTRTDDLVAQEVLAGLDTARDRERHLALVRDERVDGPLLRRRVVPVLVDLEPLEAGHGRLGRVRDLGADDDVSDLRLGREKRG